MTKAGIKAVKGLALTLASELEDFADDLAEKANGNDSIEDTLEAISVAVDGLKNETLPFFEKKIDVLHTRYVQFAHIA